MFYYKTAQNRTSVECFYKEIFVIPFAKQATRHMNVFAGRGETGKGAEKNVEINKNQLKMYLLAPSSSL